MIGILELLGMLALFAAGAVVAGMLFALACMLLSAALMDARTFLRERHVAMQARRVELKREAAHQRALEEQLSTLRAENATLTYENQTLVQRLNAAGIVALPASPGWAHPQNEEARPVVGIVEDRHP